MPRFRRRRPGWAPTVRQRVAWSITAIAAATVVLAGNVAGLVLARDEQLPRRWDGRPQARPVTDVATSTYRR